MTTVGSMTPRPVVVQNVQIESADVVTLHLDADNEACSFQPGQFNMLYAFGVGEVPISMSGDPSKVGRLAHTIRSVGAATEALCRTPRGGVVGLRGPFGTPWPMDVARGCDLVVVAGGLGLAPLRPVLYDVFRNRSDYGRVSLLVGARTAEDLLFKREVDRWKQQAAVDVQVTVDRAPAGWKGHVGVVPSLLSRIAPSAQTVAFVCGPEVMMRFTVRELRRRRVPAERIYLSMERNMKCAVGFCGHCQWGPSFVCKDGPIFRYDRVESLFWLSEI